MKVNKLLDNDGNGSFETVNPNSFFWYFASTGPYVMGSNQSNFNVGSYSLTENTVAGYHLVGWYNHNGNGAVLAQTA